jgi:hypothetical protein
LINVSSVNETTFIVVGTKQPFASSVLYSEKHKKAATALQQIVVNIGFVEAYSTVPSRHCSETRSGFLTLLIRRVQQRHTVLQNGRLCA